MGLRRRASLSKMTHNGHQRDPNPALHKEEEMPVEIVPIEAKHIEGFRRAVDQVARERKYLAMLEAPPLEKVSVLVLDNIANHHSQFVAVDDDDVVGWCDVLPKERPVYRHCGVLGMGVVASWRRKGHGRALLSAGLSHAARQGLVRIELVVRADNIRAISLYQRAGFETEGVLRDAARVDGKYYDLFLMSLIDRTNALPE
jgi:ribosomal protein S18 acetylase RimI-like enzyme